MIKNTDDEVIAYIIDRCVKEGGVKHIYSLIKTYTGCSDDDDYVGIRLLHGRIVKEIRYNDLLNITDDDYRVYANDTSHEIIANGGYAKYIAGVREKSNLTKAAQRARDIKDIRDLWLYYLKCIVAGITVIISLITLYFTYKQCH